jgi:hypothetical protein
LFIFEYLQMTTEQELNHSTWHLQLKIIQHKNVVRVSSVVVCSMLNGWRIIHLECR